jgi:hypothetical protein
LKHAVCAFVPFGRDLSKRKYEAVDCGKPNRADCIREGCSWFEGYDGPWCHAPYKVRRPVSHAAAVGGRQLCRVARTGSVGAPAMSRCPGRARGGASYVALPGQGAWGRQLCRVARAGRASACAPHAMRCSFPVPPPPTQSDEAKYYKGLGGMPNLSVSRADDCGYGNIGVSACQRRGCVWQPQKEHGAPWCRYPSPEDVAK